jgi:predicted ferric reductase
MLCPTQPNLFSKRKPEIMENLLYIIAVILVIAWAIGFLGYNAGGLIHILLVIAVIAVVLRLIRGRSPL